MRSIKPFLVAGLFVVGCGDDSGGGDTDASTGAQTTSGSTTAGSTSTSAASSGSTTTTSNSSTTGDPQTGSEGSTGSSSDATSVTGDIDSGTTGVPSECDYETVDGRLVIEAESLPIVDEWAIETTQPGYYGTGYIVWNGASSNNDPSNGEITATLYIAEPGRYQFKWHSRIGQGNDPTEHNDAWLKFPDADAFYGARPDGDLEERRYPRPICEDAEEMAAIMALPNVTVASCVQGSSTDGWFKVYSSGATDWNWVTATSDSDGVTVTVEFAAAGDYTMLLAARADFHLIDRIVLHEEGLENAVVQDPDAAETACK